VFLVAVASLVGRYGKKETPFLVANRVFLASAPPGAREPNTL